MKKLIFATFFLSLFSMSAFSQLQVGGGPAYFLNEKFLEEQNSSLDYTLSLGYAIRKFDVGFEFIKNGYKDWGNGKEFYEFYQYQAFGRFYPFKRRTWFLKGGVNYSDEKIHNTIRYGDPVIVDKIEEYGRLLGFEGGLGFQYRLIKKTNLFLNISLTYNHLSILEDGYYFEYNKEKEGFYALKMSLIYQFDFKKKKSN